MVFDVPEKKRGLFESSIQSLKEQGVDLYIAKELPDMVDNDMGNKNQGGRNYGGRNQRGGNRNQGGYGNNSKPIFLSRNNNGGSR